MTSDEANKKFSKELKAGTVSLVLLGILDGAEQPMYGYQITKEIDPRLLDVKQGALYPVLRSLERSGLLSSEVEPSASGPPRRYYTITDEGRETLKNWRSTWNQTKSLVDSVLKGNDDVEQNR
jgi:PadR family transcriptional regulator PadR